MKTIKLHLSAEEKNQLRKNGLTINRLADFAPDELAILLQVSIQRAREISALICFQTIPSIGPKFAADLVSLGYYTLDELKGKEGSILLDELERKQGFWTDPCVEDQFRLVVYYAHTGKADKNWWDFTTERKAYRRQHGYPADRPKRPWHESHLEATV